MSSDGTISRGSTSRGVLGGLALSARPQTTSSTARGGEGQSAAKTGPRPVIGEQYVEVPPALIVGHTRAQTRSGFDPDANDEDRALVESIRAEGQRIPVVVQEASDGSGGYVLQLGRRRLGAVLHLGLPFIKAIVRREGQRAADLGTLLENIRKELTPLEKARAIQILHDDHDLTYEEVARRVGLTPRYALMLMKLMGAEAGVLEQVEAETLSARAAIEVARVPAQHQVALAERVIAHRLPLEAVQQVAALMSTESLEPSAALRRVGVVDVEKAQTDTSADRESGQGGARSMASTSPGRHRAAVTGLSRATIAMVLTHLRPDLAATRVEVLSGLLEARFASTGWVKAVALVAGESEDGQIVDRARDLQRHRWAVCAVKALEALAALRDTAREGTDPVPAQVLTSLRDILQQLETDFVGEA